MAIVNIEFCTGHEERYRFATEDAGQEFLRAIAREFQEDYPNDLDAVFLSNLGWMTFRYPGCQCNYAVLRTEDDPLYPIDRPDNSYAGLAAKHGGTPAA